MKRFKAKFATLLASGALLATSVIAQEHGAGHSWSYDGNTGPSHWGDLNPEFAPCKSGHRQSPIDIRVTQKADAQLRIQSHLFGCQVYHRLFQNNRKEKP